MSLAGSFLIARSVIQEPTFARTVVLLAASALVLAVLGRLASPRWDRVG